jgi:hypothetical protein
MSGRNREGEDEALIAAAKKANARVATTPSTKSGTSHQMSGA